MQNGISIIIADDHLMFVDGLKLLLEAQEDFAIAAVANNGRELLRILDSESADVLLLDINMPGMDGIEALKYIQQKGKSIRVIMLSTYKEEHLIERAKQAGANGYVVKNSSRDELIKAIQLVSQGQSFFPAKEEKSSNNFKDEDPFLKRYNLTKRELEIIGFIKQGLTNQEIGKSLFLSVYTVETHRKNIMQKINLKSPAGLMKFIIENNL